MLWGAFRGDSLRVLRLCDFFLREHPMVGVVGAQKAPVGLGMVVDEGKTNGVQAACFDLFFGLC